MMPQPLVRHLRPASPKHSTGISKKVFNQMQLENAGVHGPFLIHAAQPPLLAALWALFRETQLASGVPRAHQETIALLIAEENRCPWCIEAHKLALHTQHPTPEIVAWFKSNPNPLEDSEMDGFSQNAMIAHRAAVILWQYINRMTNVLLVESAWQNFGSLREPLTRIMGYIFGAFFLHRNYTPGRSLEFIADAALPAHLAWAKSHHNIATALAYFHQQINQLAQGIIPVAVQHFVLEYVQEHRGQNMGLSRHWADDAVQPLEPGQQVIAKVLLLTALASYQIDDDLMLQLRQICPQDSDLLALLAWGSCVTNNHFKQLED
jgi:AhpD family alkylhydroperoxidase